MLVGNSGPFSTALAEMRMEVCGSGGASGQRKGSQMGGVTDQIRGQVRPLYWIKRWMYRSGRPGGLARVMNRISAIQFSAGLLSPKRAVTLEVQGRRTGRLISFPVVVADYEGERYLVSMLGKDANWVRNVRAAEGRATLRRHRREAVRLVEVEPGARARILRRYLALAPGARPHVPVNRHAPLEEFESIAAQFPVFRITTPASGSGDTRDQTTGMA